MSMWTSKLGNKYDKAWMQQNDQAAQRELKRLRGLKSNSTCADCNRQDNSWSSVSLGVFICVTCSDVHRSVGTHVTKVKGCTGTYLWGPDELERMTKIGNQVGNTLYGTQKVDPGASKEQKQKYVVDKYEKRAFASKSSTTAPSRSAEEPRRSLQVAMQMTSTGNSSAVTPAAEVTMSSQSKSTLASNVSSSLFDELFGDCNEAEDSYFGNAAATASKTQSQISVSANTLPSGSGDLDTFLNLTLDAPKVIAKPVVQVNQGYPSSLDPFAATASSNVEDPFADWPDF